jgi:hypothetical protein
MDAIPIIQDQNYRLILAIGPARCGSTAALAMVAYMEWASEGFEHVFTRRGDEIFVTT